MKQLFEIGERNIVQDIIYDVFPHLLENHDDTVNITVNNDSTLCFSTDPCPEPIINRFVNSRKYYYYGWMSVLINYSDLAAEAAEPIGIMLSVVMPNEMHEADFREFLLGVKEACNIWGGTLLGGNIKDGTEFSVTGTAIGKKQNDCRLLTRRGMQQGDAICVVGDMGMFWLAIMQLMDGCSIGDIDEYTRAFITKPTPKLKESFLLAKSTAITACMDSSDGVIGCLYELALLNNISIHILDSQLKPNQKLRTYCKKRGIDYRNYMLSFGGWELVFSCKPDNLEEIKSIFSSNHMKFDVIGYADKPLKEKVLLHKKGKVYKVNDFSSKRFHPTSMFSFGLEPIFTQLNSEQFEEIE